MQNALTRTQINELLNGLDSNIMASVHIACLGIKPLTLSLRSDPDPKRDMHLQVCLLFPFLYLVHRAICRYIRLHV